MAANSDPGAGREHDTGRIRGREGIGAALARATAAIADALVDPRIILAWLLAFVGAPSLIGLLVPVREGSAFLALRLAGGRHPAPSRARRLRIGASLVAGLAAFGISGAALLLWGATAGWIIVALLALIGLTAGTAAATEAPRATARPLPYALGALALLALGLVLAFELGPRGALVIWALMGAGGLSLLAAVLHAASTPPDQPPAPPEPLRHAGAPPDPASLVRLLLVPAALAPPYMVALVSENPGTGLAALGGLILASALAALLALPLARLAHPFPRRVALAAGLAAAALALAVLADTLGWIAAPFLLPVLVFAVVLADRTVRPPGAQPDAATGLALLAGALLAPLSVAIGTRAILVLLAALVLLAIPAALRLPRTRTEGA
jgi:hypothetical protein